MERRQKREGEMEDWREERGKGEGKYIWSTEEEEEEIRKGIVGRREERRGDCHQDLVGHTFHRIHT